MVGFRVAMTALVVSSERMAEAITKGWAHSPNALSAVWTKATMSNDTA